jgi:bcr-type benzoyl-CoA reductase subunit C
MIIKSKPLLERFAELSKDPLKTARQEADGRGVIAVSGMYMPEEIIHAAGYMPVVLLEQNGPVAAANAHVQPFMCGYVRSLMDQAIEKELSFTKAVFVKDCCHELRMIGDLVRYTQPDKVNIEFFFFPVTIKAEASQKFIAQEMENVKLRVEKYLGNKIEDDALRESIKVFNKFRQAMQELYQVRRSAPGCISEMALRDVVRASMSMPKEKATALVTELVEALKEDLASGAVRAKRGPKILVSGSLCESLEPAVIKAIEGAGGVIADDDLYVGGRYFNTLVDEGEDPMTALTQAYIYRNGPCCTQTDPDNRNGDYLKSLAERCGAKGIITVVIKFCEAHYFGNLADMNDLKANFSGKVYSVFTDHDTDAEGQIMTRIQSFIENL